MRHIVYTVRFTCDSWYYKGGNKWEPTDCPNTLLLTGTKKEIDKFFTQSGWTNLEYPVAQTAIEKHRCPRKHEEDSLNRPREPEYVDDANSPAAQGES